MPINNSHTVAITPKENYILWRYMDLDKFESMLRYQKAFFCRADRFADPFEGSLPEIEGSVEDRVNRQLEAAEKIWGSEITEESRLRARSNVEYTQLTHKKFRRMMVVNCWHINNNENDLMWRLYLKSNVGIAIRSTVDRLTNAFQGTVNEIQMSEVRYLNYKTDIFYHENEYPQPHYNFFMPLIHKRIELKDESELRLLYKVKETEKDKDFWMKQPFEKGMLIDLSLEQAIEKVVLPPTADKYIIAKVKEIMQKYKLDKPLTESSLSNSPKY